MGTNQRVTDQRVSAIRLVLELAERDPDAGLPYETLPEARAAFGSRRELLLALQRTWSQALWSGIATQTLHHSRRRPDVRCDEITSRAWAECAERNPVLRRLLDRYDTELGPSLRCAVP